MIQNFKKPLPLQPGDKVAIISPSSGMPFLFPWVYEQGIARLKEMFQLQSIELPTALKSPQYLSENPEARANDINEAFADPSIKAIIATIGGNDQIRILPYINKTVLQANPKIFMGFSDCTNLHLLLWNLGIISYYGGAIMTQFAMGGGMHEYTKESIKKSLFGSSNYEVTSAFEYSDEDLDWGNKENLFRARRMYPSKGWIWHNWHNESITGRLWGGCLEVLDLHLSVKRYLPDPALLRDTVLYIETSEEMPSEGFVYRFIASLGELGLLNIFQAILVGYPKAQFCEQQPPVGRDLFILQQREAIISALRDYQADTPVIFNMNFGHTDPQMIMPNGGLVTINSIERTIHFID